MEPKEILHDALLNKGTGFTQKEREKLGIEGFLPFRISTIKEQADRKYQLFKVQASNLAKYTFLSSLQSRNATLFYRLVLDHLSEILPFIYTPTIGEVALHFSSLYAETRGLYLSPALKNKIPEILERVSCPHVDVIVVTDGGRVLGLGDLGIGGMAISMGKLSIYTLLGGIHPERTLPIILDVGTNNEQLLNDPFYLGWQKPRLQGKEYADFIEAFVEAIKKKYPSVLLQWEDFGKENAKPLLDKYRDQICSFNDDIQGTAAVSLSAILTAVKLTSSRLSEQRIVIFGGGSAGMGICHQLKKALQHEGLSENEARRAFYIIDIEGLVHQGLTSISKEQAAFARTPEEISTWKVADKARISLLEVIKNVRPTILIGVSTKGGAFTEEVVTTMAKYVERPIIFPLSNPTSFSEAHPSDLIHWTKGKAIVATGSPFDPVVYNGRSYPIAQCNNLSIFPGVGLGIVASKSRKVTDEMFFQAAEILSRFSPALHDPFGSLFPSFEEIRKISREIGVAVGRIAVEEGLSHLKLSEVEGQVDKTIWEPHYDS